MHAVINYCRMLLDSARLVLLLTCRADVLSRVEHSELMSIISHACHNDLTSHDCCD